MSASSYRRRYWLKVRSRRCRSCSSCSFSISLFSLSCCIVTCVLRNRFCFSASSASAFRICRSRLLFVRRTSTSPTRTFAPSSTTFSVTMPPSSGDTCTTEMGATCPSMRTKSSNRAFRTSVMFSVRRSTFSTLRCVPKRIQPIRAASNTPPANHGTCLRRRPFLGFSCISIIHVL